jgi:hypothetical protein
MDDRMIDEVARGRPVVEVADRAGCAPQYGVRMDPSVQRQRVHDLRASVQPEGPGRQSSPARQVREPIDIALSSPAERGLPFSAWTVPKLAEYCRRLGLLPPITDEWVLSVLSAPGRPQAQRELRRLREPRRRVMPDQQIWLFYFARE